MAGIQAVLPETRIGVDYLRDLLLAQHLVVDPATIVTQNGEVFNDTEGVCLRFMQNCGTVPVKYLISNEDAAADKFHGIIAGGSVVDDGLGSIVDLSRFKGRVSIFGVGGNPRVATFRAHGPERGKE